MGYFPWPSSQAIKLTIEIYKRFHTLYRNSERSKQFPRKERNSLLLVIPCKRSVRKHMSHSFQYILKSFAVKCY